jgi:hypothetical protein
MNKIEHSLMSSIVDSHFKFVCPELKNPGNSTLYKSGSVKRKLEELLIEYQRRKGKPLIEYLDKHFKGILTGDPFVLAKHANSINRMIKSKGLKFSKKSALFRDVEKCFDYKSYIKKAIPYDILERLNVNACPYCNRQYINTFRSKKGKSRATLDHFYVKSRYPYLAISFFNLIPSCYSCNSSIKGVKKFNIKTHLHPFISSFDNTMAFTIDFEKRSAKQNRAESETYIADFYNSPKKIKIAFKKVKNASTTAYNQATRNKTDLCLEGLYAFHKDYIVELLQKNVIYGKAGYAKTIAKQYPQIFNNEHDVLNMVLGNYLYPADFNKRPFSRLTRDISAELGLLDVI